MLAPAKAARQSTIVHVIQLAVVVVFFSAWFALTGLHAISPLFLPPPVAVFAALVRLAGGSAFWSAVGVTVFSIAVAYVIASVLGVIVGFFVGRSTVLTKAYRPLFSGLFAIPLTLFFPLFVVTFGLGPASKIAFGALYAFFPVALNTIAGFAGIDQLYLRAARSQGATNAQMLRHIYIPGARPVVITGLRIGFFITSASVLGGETLSSVSGMGHAIAHEADLLEGPVMYAYIVIVIGFTMILNFVLGNWKRVQAAAVKKPPSAGAVRWITIAVLLVLWEIGARFFADPAFVAPPSKVVVALFPTIFGDPKLTYALGLTFFELVCAFVLSIVVGAIAGVAIGATMVARRSFFPFVLLLFGLPQVALLPLCILVFGLGPESRIAFGFTHGVLPIIVTTVTGMRAVNPHYLASARSMGASKWQILRHIMFPNMVASVFTGLRLSMSLTLLGVVLAELFVSSNGIGNFVQIFAETFKPAQLYSVVLVLAIMAVCVNELVGLIEMHFSRWKTG